MYICFITCILFIVYTNYAHIEPANNILYLSTVHETSKHLGFLVKLKFVKKMATMLKTLSSGRKSASLREHPVFSAQVSSSLSRKNRMLSQATEARSALQKLTKTAKQNETFNNVKNNVEQ